VMIRKLLSTTAVAGIVLGATTVAAFSNPPTTAARVQSAKPETTPAPSTADRSDLFEDAVAAVRETQNAIRFIDRNRPKEALSALERATGKLEITLARNPKLALAPVDVSAVSYDVLGTVQSVDTARAAVKNAIDAGRLQDARFLMDGLASETDVDVTNIPLASYPGAIKTAAAFLHQGKSIEAKAALQSALNTLVVTREIFPLPLTRAEVALGEAKGLAEKPARTPAETTRLRQLLGQAREQLKLAQALGYGSEKGMSDLVKEVDDIDRKTAGQQSGKGLFDRFERLFKDARSASQPKPR
jgi:hypothetical protein